MGILNFLRRRSKFIDAVATINEQERELTHMEATVNGDSKWMKRREQYCEKCEQICSEEDNDGI